MQQFFSYHICVVQEPIFTLNHNIYTRMIYTPTVRNDLAVSGYKASAPPGRNLVHLSQTPETRCLPTYCVIPRGDGDGGGVPLLGQTTRKL